jgi:hypothetical protein
MSNSTASPGTPWGPCGKAIPAGVPTPKGPGYCPPGFFCGWEQNTQQPSKCLPLPGTVCAVLCCAMAGARCVLTASGALMRPRGRAHPLTPPRLLPAACSTDKCGTAGNACCPSNTDSPHTSLSDKLNRKPYCKDGSTCFYFSPVPGLDNGDFYAGNKGGCVVWSASLRVTAAGQCTPKLLEQGGFAALHALLWTHEELDRCARHTRGQRRLCMAMPARPITPPNTPVPAVNPVRRRPSMHSHPEQLWHRPGQPLLPHALPHFCQPHPTPGAVWLRSRHVLQLQACRQP